MAMGIPTHESTSCTNVYACNIFPLRLTRKLPEANTIAFRIGFVISVAKNNVHVSYNHQPEALFKLTAHYSRQVRGRPVSSPPHNQFSVAKLTQNWLQPAANKSATSRTVVAKQKKNNQGSAFVSINQISIRQGEKSLTKS